MNRFVDSYDHYRTKVGLGRVAALWRTIYREVTGRDR